MVLYYLVVCILLTLAGPFLLLSPKRRAGLRQKLGAVPEGLPLRLAGTVRPVWFHAVSVGEFNAVWPLVCDFHARHPQIPLVISTATRTGQELARERAKEIASVVYFPLELPWALNNWLDAVHPGLVVIVETEIWPGFTHECERRSIPLVVVNGRISPRSFRKYYRWRAFFGRVIKRFKIVLAQSEADADRYRAIAGDGLPVTVTGNLKFDGLKQISEEEAALLRAELGIAADDLVIVGGSTHEGEEQALLEALEKLAAPDGKLAKTGKTVRLILAPRHPERWDHVESVTESHGFKVRRCSRGEKFESDRDVYMLDTIGQLFRYYSLATVAFVGGTLGPVGGHSLVEPYVYGVPVVCGPYTFKTQDAANGLKAAEALAIVAGAQELGEKLSSLLSDEETRHRAGESGRAWVQASQGAVGRTLRIVESVVGEQYNESQFVAE